MHGETRIFAVESTFYIPLFRELYFGLLKVYYGFEWSGNYVYNFVQGPRPVYFADEKSQKKSAG